MNYRHIFILLLLIISGCQNSKSLDVNNNVSTFGDNEDEFENLITKTDKSNQKYRSELSLAVADNDLEKIKFYLSKGANPNTAIFHAVENRNLDIVQTFLEDGADPNIIQYNYKDTPSLLMRASNYIRTNTGEYYQPSSDMVNLLIKHGADLNYENIYGNVISYIVCENKFYIPIQDKDSLTQYNMIKFFIDKGVSVNIYCKNDATPLSNLYEFKYSSRSDSYRPNQKKRREENIKNAESIMASIRDRDPIVGLIESAGGIEDGNPHGSWTERNILMPIVEPFLKMH